MKASIAACSLLGAREEQQDSYIYRINSVTLAAVCDGMGGMRGGQKASSIATQIFKEDVKNNTPISNYASFLEREIDCLDKAVYELVDDKGVRLNAGTTIASVLIEQDRLFYMSVGDSRIYMKRGEEMLPVTREHNYKLQLDSYLEAGSITENEYKKELFRADQLISYIGLGDIVVKDVSAKPIHLIEGDMFLLCSDGLTKTINDNMLNSFLQSNNATEDIVEELKSYCMKHGGNSQDNTTFILIKMM